MEQKKKLCNLPLPGTAWIQLLLISFPPWQQGTPGPAYLPFLSLLPVERSSKGALSSEPMNSTSRQAAPQESPTLFLNQHPGLVHGLHNHMRPPTWPSTIHTTSTAFLKLHSDCTLASKSPACIWAPRELQTSTPAPNTPDGGKLAPLLSFFSCHLCS